MISNILELLYIWKIGKDELLYTLPC